MAARNRASLYHMSAKWLVVNQQLGPSASHLSNALRSSCFMCYKWRLIDSYTIDNHSKLFTCQTCLHFILISKCIKIVYFVFYVSCINTSWILWCRIHYSSLAYFRPLIIISQWGSADETIRPSMPSILMCNEKLAVNNNSGNNNIFKPFFVIWFNSRFFSKLLQYSRCVHPEHVWPPSGIQAMTVAVLPSSSPVELVRLILWMGSIVFPCYH